MHDMTPAERLDALLAAPVLPPEPPRWRQPLPLTVRTSYTLAALLPLRSGLSDSIRAPSMAPVTLPPEHRPRGAHESHSAPAQDVTRLRSAPPHTIRPRTTWPPLPPSVRRDMPASDSGR